MTHQWQPHQLRLSTIALVAALGPPVIAAFCGVFGQFAQYLAILLIGIPLVVLVELALAFAVLISTFWALEWFVRRLWRWFAPTPAPAPQTPPSPYNEK